MVGATSDLYSLPSDPRPGADAAAVFGFSINCYRGYTYEELSNGATAHTPGTTSNFSPAAKVTPGQYTCVTGCQASGGSSTAQGYFCSESTDSSCNSNFDPLSVQGADYQCAASGGDDPTITTESSSVATTTASSNPTPATTLAPTATTESSNPTPTTAASTTTTASDTGDGSSDDGDSSSASSDDDGATSFVLIAVGAVVGVAVVAVFAFGCCKAKVAAKK